MLRLSLYTPEGTCLASGRARALVPGVERLYNAQRTTFYKRHVCALAPTTSPEVWRARLGYTSISLGDILDKEEVFVVCQGQSPQSAPGGK